MNENLTFESLPTAVASLTSEICELKRLILNNQEKNKPIQEERLLSIQQAAEYLNLTVPTLYSKTSNGSIPFMKRGKKLYFSSLELINYLKEGRKKSNAEIEAEASSYLNYVKK